jgi:hypothetical protein
MFAASQTRTAEFAPGVIRFDAWNPALLPDD